MRYGLIAFLLVCCLSCQTEYETPKTIILHDSWQFKQTDSDTWLSAKVPGNVFSDLMENGLINDPFIGNNEELVQGISKTDWEYKTNFKVDAKTLNRKHIELIFEGLDTYATVYLSDSLILKTNNAFRRFAVDVKPYLKAENELRILFESTSKYEEEAKVKLNYTLPEGNRIFTRKAQFQYGWDWGPKLNTSGIWRDVKLQAWDDFKIDDVYVKQLELNDSIAKLNTSFELRTSIANLNYDLYINDSLTKSADLSDKDNSQFDFYIKNPKRWWPHNLGQPYLYDIKVVVKDGETLLDSVSKKVGLRTIDLVNEKDSLGESFYFKVNGVPVYAKGANYIPQNSFQNQVTDEHYEKLLNDVVTANMNVLRVWGGGIYENDVFYELCDEKGILVWQDFMFACAMYPGDDAFLENVEQEAIDNITRLRNHPSIALWCGNNENSEGWHRWGWQDGRREEEKHEIWSSYLKVFDSILPRTVGQYSDTDYWESSPKFGRGNPKYEFEGDAHDWWIWHDGYPFEHLEEHVPRFMSEFGFQSFPSYQAIKYINQNDSLDITSEGFKNHQKHTRGFQIIDAYMQRDFPVSDNAEDYVYVSQLLQAYGITKGIEAQRRAKPYNMGTLFWQLNDCWPAVSWSSIDFFGNWKALHYKAKRSFENLLISSKVENNILNVYAINDSLEKVPLNLNVRLLDFDGKSIMHKQIQDVIPFDVSKQIFNMDLNDINFDKQSTVLRIDNNDQTWLYYFSKPKDLKLKPQAIQKTITKTDEGFKIELSCSTLQKDVFLFCNEKGHFSDNYFDLLPKEKKTIMFFSQAINLSSLKIKTLNGLKN
ncbi:beta-mannosidase [Hanstruepera neustonica]|uniref:Beta-mannosidase B n=1 Tax=Hanstruepera neustonica TaxID=1445657 RepID=A0A2K1E195_9FLAO|nr:glycoside hydrolase family 2 protein [Hanstruepera neustonica]PNQ74041.1 beta-mannosidase [Hanstruepera neustonica]